MICVFGFLVYPEIYAIPCDSDQIIMLPLSHLSASEFVAARLRQSSDSLARSARVYRSVRAEFWGDKLRLDLDSGVPQ